MNSTNLALAEAYAAHGVPVFPCRGSGERAKSPHVAHGFHQASASPATLRQWAAMFPHALYGLPCAPNELFVLDADRHGKGDGVANVMELFARRHFDEQSVPVVQTPNNGLHFMFQKPAGLGKTRGRIAEAVDVRDNGYIIAAGNRLADGRGYALMNGTVEQLASAIANRTLPMMPDWLIAAALQPQHASSLLAARPLTAALQSQRAISPFAAPADAAMTPNQLRGLVRAIVGAPAGTRNRTLFWASCRLGGLVSQHKIDREAAIALLQEAGRQAGLAPREAYATALSGLRQGERDASYGC